MNGREEPDLPLAQPLTPREQEILICLGDGMSNRQIAEHMTVALNTVKWYVRQIFGKLGVGSRRDAVSRARRLGLLPAAGQEISVRHNIPAAITPFVGRKKELIALAKLIADPQVRIITIAGPGGIGKTRLSLEAAAKEILPGQQFPDGVFFISLAPIHSADDVITVLAAALDFHFHFASPIPRTEARQILDYLQHKKMLLIMDNFEHVLESRSFLTEIIRQAPKIKLLVTSRERLQLRSEQLFPLQGLEMPQIGDSVTEPIDGYPAAQLFMNTSRRTVPDFKYLPGDVEQLIRICRLVEGMPLALELAASWVSLLPLSDVAAEIEGRLNFLSASHYDVPERHRSIQAVLDTSWRRLNTEQKLGFQALTLFRGGLTRLAALEVAGVTMPLMVTLVNKSWLSYDRETDRYSIHELLRQYGASSLRNDSTLEQEMREKHSDYFFDYLKEREADWFGTRQREVASEVETEIENIQSAWRDAASHGDGKKLARGLNCLCHYYFRRGRMADGQKACRLARNGFSNSLAEQQGDDPLDLALWSRILAWESDFVNDMGQKKKLLSESQSILDRAAPTGLDTRREQAFIYLANAYAAFNRNHDEAIRFSSLGLELFRELGDLWGEAESASILGGNYAFRGEFERANDLLHSSTDIRLQMDDKQGVAENMLNLGVVAGHQGNFEEAELLHRKGLRLFRLLENPLWERNAQGVLSLTLSWAGKFGAAKRAAERGLEVDRDLGQFTNPFSLNAFTTAAMHLGCYAEALDKASIVLETSTDWGLMMEIGSALMIQGNVALAEGNLAEAKYFLLESVAIFAELKTIYRALPEVNLSYVVRSQGDRELARNYLLNALRFGIETRSTLLFMCCLPAAALIAADDGQQESALTLYYLMQQFGHFASSRWFDDVACRELEILIRSFTPEITSAAETSHNQIELWAVAEQLLLDLAK